MKMTTTSHALYPGFTSFALSSLLLLNASYHWFTTMSAGNSVESSLFMQNARATIQSN